MLLSNQKKIIEQSKFRYSPLGKAFEKQIKTFEDQGKKQVDALKDLKDNKEKWAEAIEEKSDDKSDQSQAADIFNDLIEKRRNIMNDLYENFDMNKLYFMWECATKDANFNEYYDSKQHLNGIKTQHIKLDDALKKQKELLKKINQLKIGKKSPKLEKK